MIKALLIAVLIFSQNGRQQEDPKPPERGIVAGVVSGPGQTRITQPLQIILMGPEYAELYSSDVQKRLDVYWERYKPAFAEKKEFFNEVSRMAYRESLQYVVNRMRRELREQFSEFLKDTTPTGGFEFRNLAFGSYQVVAIGTIGETEYVWQEFVEVNSPIPQFIQLDKQIP